MDKKQICIKFAREICDILDISAPDIKFVSADRMHTGTQIAALTPDAVLIRNDIEISAELFFALAHELRHAYQIASGESLEEYRTVQSATTGSRCECIWRAYHVGFFGIVPQFRNIPDTVRKAISDHMEQIHQ